MVKTPGKYDSIIDTEYERYKEDCGLKIGDHKILCKVFDAQDDNLQAILSEGYDIQAKLITDVVREMLVAQDTKIEKMLVTHKKDIFNEIGKIKKAVEDLASEVRKQKEEISCVESKVEALRNDVERLNNKNTEPKIQGRIWKGVWIGVAIMTVVYMPLTIFLIWYLYTNYWHK